MTINAPQNDLDRAIRGAQRSIASYRKAHEYYEAEAPEVFASRRLRRAMMRSGMSLQMNFSKTVVDSVVDRLEVGSITVMDKESSAADELIQRVQRANKFALQHVNWIRKASTYGDCYVMVWPKSDAVPGYVEDAGGAPAGRHVYQPEDLRLIYQDPRGVRAHYNRDDSMIVDFVSKQWLDEDGHVRIDLYYSDRIECYRSKTKTNTDKSLDFQPHPVTEYYLDTQTTSKQFEEEHIMPNPFGVIPFFHFRTDADEYGKPEHKDFYPVHDAIHKLALGHISGVDYQAFPQRYALMNPDSDTSEAARLDEGFFSYDLSNQGTTEDIMQEGVSQFSSDPGSVWMANDVKGFGQFDVADAKNFTEPMEFYLRCGATVTNTPLHYFEPGGTIPSGEALRTEEAPFIKKIKNRQLSYGDTLEEMFVFVLSLLGTPDARVTVDWVPAETWDDKSFWEVVTSKQAAGVPVEQTLLEAKYTSAQIEEWNSNGQGDLPQRVQLFYQVGEAMASFSTAVSTGMMKPEQVVDIMGKLLGDTSAGIGESDRIDPPANPIPETPPAPAAGDQVSNQQDMSTQPGQQRPQRIMNGGAPPTSKPTKAPGTGDQ